MRGFKSHFVLTAVVAALLAAGPSCKKTNEAAQSDDSRELPLSSVVHVAEPGAQRQLLDGFWGVENNAWRWTKHRFEVALLPPAGAAQKGARLDFRFALTKGLLDRQKSVTVTAMVGSATLPPDTYTEPGNCVYIADVPASAFASGGTVRVAFVVDKYFHTGEIDSRELALIAQSVGLLPR